MIKGIVNGVEKDITRIPMVVNSVEKNGWEVRKGDGTLIWGRNDTISVDSGTIHIKGYGVPLKGVEVEGNMTQTGTPTPDNPVMPEFVGVRTNNLSEWEKGGINTSTGADEAYRTAAQVGTCEQMRSLYTPCSGNTSYVLHSNHYPVQTFISYYDVNKNYISRSGGSQQGENRIFTTPETARYMRAQLAHATQSQVYPAVEENQQYAITLGSTALPYEPYGYKIPITCSGQTTPIYLGQAQTVRKVKKLVFDGAEKWRSTAVTGGLAFLLSPVSATKDSNSANVLSTHYKPQYRDNDGNIYITNHRIVIVDFSFDLVDSFKSYLAAQYANGTPVTVWYVLAEPETAIINEPLCKIGDYADTLTVTDQDVTITPAVGNDTLSVDTTLPPSKLTVVGHIRERST